MNAKQAAQKAAKLAEPQQKLSRGEFYKAMKNNPDVNLVTEEEADRIYELLMRHKAGEHRANLFLIGGGMISAPRPNSIHKALKIAKESGVDPFLGGCQIFKAFLCEEIFTFQSCWHRIFISRWNEY